MWTMYEDKMRWTESVWKQKTVEMHKAQASERMNERVFHQLFMNKHFTHFSFQLGGSQICRCRSSRTEQEKTSSSMNVVQCVCLLFSFFLIFNSSKDLLAYIFRNNRFFSALYQEKHSRLMMMKNEICSIFSTWNSTQPLVIEFYFQLRSQSMKSFSICLIFYEFPYITMAVLIHHINGWIASIPFESSLMELA